MDSNTNLFEPISINEVSENLEAKYIADLPESASVKNDSQNYVNLQGSQLKSFSLIEKGIQSTGELTNLKSFPVREENTGINVNSTLLSNDSVTNAEINEKDIVSQDLIPLLLVPEEMNINEKSTDKNEQNPDTSNMQFVVNINSINDTQGVLYIGCTEEGEKTNPEKISEWFTPDFINMHKVYAIREEEAFLLKIYTRVSEVANKVLRKKGGRKSMLMGQEVYGEIIVACGRCGYRSSEGGNVRRHLRRSVCARDRGYSIKELDGLNRTERQKFIRRIASAKFRAKRKSEEIDEHASGEAMPKNESSSMFSCVPTFSCNSNGDENITNETSASSNKCSSSENIQQRPTNKCLKVKRKPPPIKALTLGPLVKKAAVKRVSFDVFTVNEDNVRVAWKPPACHKASNDLCQIVFKGARMKRRCLDVPLPLVLTYRKLDCKVHRCNFTLFHPHARKAIKEDTNANASIIVRTYGDTVMTQEFYHYFVSLITVMKMKSSQFARHLTSVWETILIERLQMATVPEEFKKIITLSKQTVKSIWASIEEESGKGTPIRLTKSSKKRKRPPSNSLHLPSSQAPIQQQPSEGYTDISFTNGNLAATQPIHVASIQDSSQMQSPQHQLQHSQHLPQHTHQQEFHRQPCIKRFLHVIPKVSSVTHSSTISHHPTGNTHTIFQGHPPPPHPPTHWMSQTHPHQYPPNMPYCVPPQQDDYYSVQASFVTQYTPASIGTSP